MLKPRSLKMAPLITLFLLLVAPMQAGTTVGNPENEEYDLKATFLYRFTDYIEWTQNHRSDRFSIAVLGESLITEPLLAIAKVKKVKNKKIDVKQYKSLEEIGRCDILFVPANCPVPIETILSAFEAKSVLIVSEKEGYGKKGAHLNFIIVENKLKFEVNPKTMNRSDLAISAFLLQHAIIIE